MRDSATNSIKKLIKWKLKGDRTTFEGHEHEYKCIYDLFERTTLCNESNSALLIGPRQCGKTTMIQSIIKELEEKESFRRNTIIVQLNGLIHTDDGLALDAIANDMKLDTMDDGKVFGSFAENLSFLLESLKSADREKSKGIIFILEHFDLFCAHHNQTLLYNLFDVAQSAQAPICVIGITSRTDVIELLEKRVKSRFSHRQYSLNPEEHDFETRMNLFEKLLTISYADMKSGCEFKIADDCIGIWNESIKNLAKSNEIRQNLEQRYDICILIASFKIFLYQVISKLSESHPFLIPQDFSELVENLRMDNKIPILCGLSVMELCLVVAMKHHCQIYDRDHFNFEMILTRFNKFAATTSTLQNISRDVVHKAFERILQLELIIPESSSGINNTLKQFRFYYLILTFAQIDAAVSKYTGLPTDISQWAITSPV